MCSLQPMPAARCGSRAAPAPPTLQMSVRNCFVRGSVVRYVHVSARPARAVAPRPPPCALPPALASALCTQDGAGPCLNTHPLSFRPLPAQLPPGSVDVEILHDATRREAKGG